MTHLLGDGLDDAHMRREESHRRLRLAVEVVPLNYGFVPDLRREGRDSASLALGLPT